MGDEGSPGIVPRAMKVRGFEGARLQHIDHQRPIILYVTSLIPFLTS